MRREQTRRSGEAAKTPALADEIRLLHWIESITQVPRGSAAHEAGPSGAPDDGPLAPGDRWGTLEIRERIGRGAAGDVYRAFDPALEREVALKIWREDALHRTTGTEARRLRRIEHPAVLKVLGVERHDGLAGMWTDFVAGRNLEEILAESEEMDNRRQALSHALSVLNDRERRIFEARRLADDPVTLEELAEEFGVSRERVRQIEVRAFEKVQKAVKSRMAAMEKPAETSAISAH